MRHKMFLVAALTALLLAAHDVGAQSIVTDGDVEAQGFIGDGSQVTEVDAQLLDGMDSNEFAQAADLQSAEAMLVALQAQVDALGLALVPRTGQTTCYDAAGTVVRCDTGIGQGQDGDLQLGVTWPNPRFTDNGNGTVMDNLTGLTWLDDANCFGTQTWADALAKAAALFDGCADCGGTNMDCGLTDRSGAGEWRLPSVRELRSLVHYGVFLPAVPNTAGTGQWSEGDPFSGVQLAFYWSSTTTAGITNAAWAADMDFGTVTSDAKTFLHSVWLVRGGQ